MSVLIVITLIALVSAKVKKTVTFEANIKVAFIADQGAGPTTRAVLRLIEKEKASLVVHSGDFDYEDDPNGWNREINRVLGNRFPYIASVGNHEVGPWWLFYHPWPSYQEKLVQRLRRTPLVQCSGDIGVKSLCRYKGLVFVFSGVGTIETEHNAYISEKLSANPEAIWKICSWHKNQEEMQVSTKGDQVGWNVYETCRQHGAIIATGHSHIYARTKTLIDMQNQVVDPSCSDPNVACVGLGKTFSFVSGLGGHSKDVQKRCFDGCKGEWASIYTTEQNSSFGALFIIFNYNGDPYQAHGYFKNIQGQVIDEFDIIATPSVLASLPASNIPVVMPAMAIKSNKMNGIISTFITKPCNGSTTK